MQMKWLIVLRVEAGYNQKQLAEKIGISSQALSNIENGRRNPSGLIAYRISKVLNFDIGKFYEEESA